MTKPLLEKTLVQRMGQRVSDIRRTLSTQRAYVRVVCDARTSLGSSSHPQYWLASQGNQPPHDASIGELSDLDGNALTPLLAEELRVLPVVCNDDERRCCLCEHLLAELAGASSLDAVERCVDLVCSVDGDVNAGKGIDVAELQASLDDELLALETSGYEPALGIDRGTLLNDAFNDVRNSRA